MRLILALLALLTGLAMPQAASAVAASRVDSSLVVSESTATADARKACPMAAVPAAKTRKPTSTTIWLPTVAVIAPAPVFFGDRARE